ncbi:MAG: carbohydrate kinase family protein [Gaiellaceae bacterium]
MCTLGDVLLDVIVRLDSALAAGDDATAATALAPGGQAANVASWAAALGASAQVVAVRADDDAGRLAQRGLAERDVEVRGPLGARTGVVVSLVQPDGARTMASDRGSAPELHADDLDAAWFACDALHLSGYSLMREPIAGAAARAAELARANGATISVDLSSWTHIERFGETLRGALSRIRPDVAFGNEREWETLGALDSATQVVKRGAEGIRVDGVEHAAHAARVVDTTGAGDALAAGFLVGGIDVALATAARCVAQVGAMP